jgi:cell division protein FtsZ
MKKVIENIVTAEVVKEQLKKQIKGEEKKAFGKRKTSRDPGLKIAGVNNEELEKILENLTTTIKVVGCGGAGTNTITRCFGVGINGADLIAVNTDAQHLLLTESPHKILIGRHLTRGLGAGSLPQIGEEAAKESEQDIRDAIVPSDMVFVTCGLGGGTGTGCSPVIAQMGALVLL